LHAFHLDGGSHAGLRELPACFKGDPRLERLKPVWKNDLVDVEAGRGVEVSRRD